MSEINESGARGASNFGVQSKLLQLNDPIHDLLLDSLPKIKAALQNDQEATFLKRQDDYAIQTVKKKNVFAEQISQEEQSIIQERVTLQQRQYIDYEKREFERKSCKLLAKMPILHGKEIQVLLEVCEDEDEAIQKLDDYEFICFVRKMIATEVSENFQRVANSTPKRKAKKICYDRIKLNDALQLLEENPEEALEKWSEARKIAFGQLKQNPNRYYYRFNKPGEKQRNGPWTLAEKELFKKRLNEVGANGNWGIFSMEIPGRVGYQCSNYYRSLIASGEIFDPLYAYGDDGKLKFVGKSGSRKKRRKIIDDVDLQIETEPEEATAVTGKAEKCSLLPDFIDPITLELVSKPAISPYGHVMGYDSWVRCLSSDSSKNKCPITKLPLKKRELVVLTLDNIENYRSKIVNQGAI